MDQAVSSNLPDKVPKIWMELVRWMHLVLYVVVWIIAEIFAAIGQEKLFVLVVVAVLEEVELT